MATQYSVGHGMRRRNGTHSNPLEAAGTNMARNHMTSDEHHASAASAGSHRISVGAAGVDFTPVMPTAGTLMPRKNTQAADPTGIGTKQNRVNIEKIGATYRVQPKATFMQVDPSAGPTMASARVVPSVQGRAAPNFESGMQASY
jgi:hypothetical protein